MGFCSCCGAVLFVIFLGILKTMSPWAFLTDLPGCSREPLPGNETGLRVVLGAPGKSGTKTLSYFLTTLGVPTYHSHDYSYFGFEEFIKKEWDRRGATFFNWESMGTLTWNMSPVSGDWMASALSKCRPGGMAFDGVEGIYPSVVERSPGVKAIVIERPWPEWTGSMSSFALPVLASTAHDFFMSASLQSLLPWGVFVRLVDQLLGSPAAKTLEDGFPLVTDTMPPLTFMHYMMVNHRRHHPMWMTAPPSSFMTNVEEKYKSQVATMRNAVPRERMFEFDFRKHKAEDLCEFLGISPCPRSGNIPRQPNSFPSEQDNPISASVSLTVMVFYYWVNWRLLWWLWGLLWAPRTESRGLAEKKGR